MEKFNDADGPTDRQTVELRLSDIQIVKENHAARTNYYFTLTVIEGNDFGTVYLLDRPETVIGRSDDIDITLDDEKASRRHLKIIKEPLDPEEKALHVLAIDLQSKNGTYVNGERITEVELHNSDKLQVGNSILKFEVKDHLDLTYHERLYKQATRDALTGLWNRAHVQEALEKFWSMSKRYGRPFSVMLYDIDNFKGVNDNYGHDVGDIVLRTTAQVIMGQVRSHDLAARYGGEEFLVLMPETPIEGAMVAAERLRHAIEGIDFTSMGCPRRVTVSIGIAQYPISAETIDELIKQADEALYQAKQSGRNRVCVAKLKE
jgi:two-component system, cell cycle response regulator